MKTSPNKPALVLHLQKLLSEIDDLFNQHDAGDKTIINSLAEKIMVIFHNSAHSKSLLTQLKLGHILLFCSSETYNSKSLTNFIGLLKLEHQKETGWGYNARLNQSDLTNVSQENWWQNKKVIVDSDGVSFTRSKIIKSIADSTPLNLNTSGWIIKDTSGNKSTINPIPETVRQIAFELLESFKHVDLNKESKLHFKV